MLNGAESLSAMPYVVNRTALFAPVVPLSRKPIPQPRSPPAPLPVEKNRYVDAANTGVVGLIHPMMVNAPVRSRFSDGLLLSAPMVKNSSEVDGPYSIEVPNALFTTNEPYVPFGTPGCP